MALFASRSFRAQLVVLSRAVTNFSGRDGALAREALTKTFIAGSVLVIAINEARGERTDLNPLVRTSRGLRVNGNFLRIKNAGGVDISPFGKGSSRNTALCCPPPRKNAIGRRLGPRRNAFSPA